MVWACVPFSVLCLCLFPRLGMSDEDSRASTSSSSSSSSTHQQQQQDATPSKKRESKASMSKTSKLLSTSAKRWAYLWLESGTWCGGGGYYLITRISLWLQTPPCSLSSFQVLLYTGCSKWFKVLQLHFILDMLPLIPRTDEIKKTSQEFVLKFESSPQNTKYICFL